MPIRSIQKLSARKINARERLVVFSVSSTFNICSHGLNVQGIDVEAEISAKSRALPAPLTNQPSPIQQAPIKELQNPSAERTASCCVPHSKAALSSEIALQQMTRPAGLIDPSVTASAMPHMSIQPSHNNRDDQNPVGTRSNLPPYPEHTALLGKLAPLFASRFPS